MKINFSRQKNLSRPKGYALISVIVIMMVLLAITLYLADALFTELTISRNQKSATVAFHLAEAGIQEAIWRIQFDPTTRNSFLNTTNGETTFNHNPALLTNGSFEVTIKNTAEASADITSFGYYQIGLKQAQRRILVKVTTATGNPPYDLYGAILTGGASGEEDITITNTTLNITGSEMIDHDNDPLTPDQLTPVASLISNRDIWFTDSTVNIAKDIIAKRDYRDISSDVTLGGTIKENDTGDYEMPEIDVTSEETDSYKSLAQAQNQYFDDQTFADMLDDGSLNFTGVVYVAGGSGISINSNRSLSVTGVLVSEGSIDVGKPNQAGTLTINHSGDNPSGVIALNKLTVHSGGQVTIDGLVYIGDRFSFDPSASKTIDIEGGVLARRFSGNGPRTVNIELNRAWINQVLQQTPDETPIIQTQYWEEEY